MESHACLYADWKAITKKKYKRERILDESTSLKRTLE